METEGGVRDGRQKRSRLAASIQSRLLLCMYTNILIDSIFNIFCLWFMIYSSSIFIVISMKGVTYVILLVIIIIIITVINCIFSTVYLRILVLCHCL